MCADMPRKAQRDAEKTRVRILASALSLFAKKGYVHTTFNDIAARLKMTKGAVYWHFESKQALLMALIDEMLEKFRRQIAELLPPGETSFDGLSFPVVADMMVRNAVRIIGDPKGTAFFLLIHEQIQWAEASMSKVREDLMRNQRFGPWAAFRTAVQCEFHRGRKEEHGIRKPRCFQRRYLPPCRRQHFRLRLPPAPCHADTRIARRACSCSCQSSEKTAACLRNRDAVLPNGNFRIGRSA